MPDKGVADGVEGAPGAVAGGFVAGGVVAGFVAGGFVVGFAGGFVAGFEGAFVAGFAGGFATGPRWPSAQEAVLSTVGPQEPVQHAYALPLLL